MLHSTDLRTASIVCASPVTHKESIDMKRLHFTGAGLLTAGLILALCAAAPAHAAVNSAFSLLPQEANIDVASPAAVEARRVEIHPAALERGGERLVLPRFDGAPLEAVRESVEVRGPGDLAWRGWILDGEHRHNVTLTLKNGYLLGLIDTPDGRYELMPLADGGQALARLDPSLFPGCATEAEENLVSGTARQSEAVATATATATAPQPHPEGATNLIDFMVVYSTAAKTAAGGQAAIEAVAQAAVDVSNTAYANSLMNTVGTLVHTLEVSYTESGDIFTDRNWVQAEPVVRQARDDHGADLVGFLVANGGGFCGVAFLMGNQDPAGFEDFGYQVTALSCAVGNLSFPHEHGHNMGFQHDPPNGASPGQAVRPYAYGHTVNGSYRTVMAYSSVCTSGCTRVAQFSNPDVMFNSVATGIADARDNVRAGEFTLPFVADWRAALDEIFTDGFESGNTSAWGSVVN
jgi:hypothetical protein